MSRSLQQIQELQRQVNSSQEVLKSIFYESLRAVNADQGFIAFEDANHYLSILVSEGTYWYLPSDAGLTGRAFTKGKVVVSDPNDPTFRKAGGEVNSEIIVPIYQGDYVVGVMLMDTLKQTRFRVTRDGDTLQKYAIQIKDVIEEQDPWAFRTWWTGYQKRKHENLVEDLQTQLIRFLKEFKDVEGYIGLVSEDGKIEERRKIGEIYTPMSIWSEPIEEAVLLGKPKLIDKPMKKYECIVPFPLEGPVVGIIKLESYKEHTFAKRTIKDIQKFIAEIYYDHLSPGATSGSADPEFYFNLLHTSLTSYTLDLDIDEVLENIAEQTKVLCRANVRIGFIPNEVTHKKTHTTGTKPVFIETYDGLKKRFEKINIGSRPRCIYLDNLIVCPVFIDDEIVGVVEIEPQDPLDDKFNKPLIKIIAVVTREVIKQYRLKMKSSSISN